MKFILSLILSFAFIAPTHAAESFLKVDELITPSGMNAWLVQDKTVPVIAISILFKGGSVTDPKGKEGIANLASALMDEGAGDRDAKNFQKALKDHAISFSFQAGRDGFYGQIKTTVQHKNLAFSLLKDAINAPRFDEDAVERMRAAILTGLRYDEQDAGWHAQKSLFETIYKGHPYGRLSKGTAESVAAITIDDLQSYAAKTFTRDNVVIGLAGDITSTEATNIIQDIFGGLPETADRIDIKKAKLNLSTTPIHAKWDGPQGVIMMAQKGVNRTDKDWFTAQLLNYTLGGGGFSSRLMEEVRVKRGLTYGVSTSIIDYIYAPLMLGQASVDVNKIDEAISVIREQWQAMADKGVTEQELANAKSYLIGSLPLSLSSTNAIASILVQMQEDGLPPYYLDHRADDINAVTHAQINNFAKTYLDPANLTIAIAGPEKGGE